MNPPRDIRLQVVLDQGVAIYSGMVPGFVADDYAKHELEIDVLPLARRAGAGVVFSAATDLDPAKREIHVEGRPPLRYDLASLDVGSTVRGLELPGVARFALATRPIARFVRELEARLAGFVAHERPPRILIIGGGAAGSEIAFTLDARLRRAGLAPSIAVVTSDAEILAGANRLTRRALRREALRRGIETISSHQVREVDRLGIVVEATGSDLVTHLAGDLVIWAAGAAPVAFPLGAGAARLARDAEGYLEIRDSLQTVGFDDVFAIGDCARSINHPWIPRAGVYAVRQGPILEANLRARLEGRALKDYRPQRDFLSLLNLGNGRALGSKWGLAIAGKPVFRLKDAIDRRFMALFQVLDEHGRPRPQLAELGAMGTSEDGSEEMACGGCAAKLGARPLSTALTRLPKSAPDPSVLMGLDARDDVAVTRDAAGRLTLHNVDVIRAFCDDPWLVGRVATANALSDLFAKGGWPRHAQAVIGAPKLEPEAAEEWLFQTLSGIRSVLDAHEVTLLGGHTTIGEDATVGLSVTGDAPDGDRLLRQAGGRAGDDLLLSQGLGIGVVLAADMQGRARSDWVVACHEAMQRTNAIGGRLAQAAGVQAATDVTGFGLAGHLATMLDGSDLVARLDRNAMPFLPGAAALWALGLRSTAHPANRAAFVEMLAGASESDEAWLYDPQTSGGLLLATAPATTPGLIEAFQQAGEPPLVRIGTLLDRVPAAGRDAHLRIEIGERI